MSFRSKTIIGVAIIELVLLVIMIASVLMLLNASHQKELNQRASMTATLFATMSKDAVLSYDLATLESFVNELLDNDDVVYARIIADGAVLAKGGDKKILQKPFEPDLQLDSVDDGVFDSFAEISAGGRVYGRVEVGLSINRIQQVLAKVRHWTIGIAAVEISLVAIFSFVLGTWLTRELFRLKSASETIARVGPGTQIETRGNDEVAQVIRSFNFMSEELLNSYTDLRETTEAHRLAALEASRSEALNAAILSASLDAVLTIDRKGIIVEYNQAAEQIFGFSRERAIGTTMSELIVPHAYREAHQNGMAHYLETGHGPVLNQRIELEALRENGEIFPIELTIAPIKTREEIFFTAFIRDITQQLQDKKELRLSAQALEAQEAIFISDQDNRIVRINHAFTAITGYSEEETLGNNPSMISSGRHEPAFYKNMWQTIQEKGSWQGEIYNKRKNGDIYPEWLSITVVKDEQGQISNYLAHFIDITERKLAEQRLTEARIEAEQASKAKSTFLATMSHEIRTPMNAILGTVGLLKDTPLEEEQHKYLDTCHDAAHSLLHLINQVLDFSKIEAGKLTLEKHAFSLRSVVKQIEGLFLAKAREQQNQLVTLVDVEIPDILVTDSSRLQQILINLINNAIKFTRKGTVTLEVSALQRKPESIELRFNVKDTGIGIKPEDQKLLFREFSQIDHQTNRQFEGTGLGLAICRELVTLLGSKIGVESEPGKGSNFWFTLELDIGKTSEFEEPVPGNVNHSENINNGGIIPNRVLRVLLVEDSEANVMVASAIIGKAGHQVDVAGNGIEALEALQRSQENKHFYDIVLMDLMMPEMDGLEATKKIRAMPVVVANVPIIAMTANAMSGDRERCLAAGMDDYIAKPFDAALLLQKLAQHATTVSKAGDSNVQPGPGDESQADDQIPEYLDESCLRQLTEDTSEEMVPKMVEVFIRELDTRRGKLSDALAAGNREVIGYEAHALKSSSGTYGASILHQLSVALDKAFKESHDQQLFELCRELLEVIPPTIDAYQERYGI